MTRKLFSLTLSAFALLLLMGAGVEQSSAALVSKSNGTAAEAAGPRPWRWSGRTDGSPSGRPSRGYKKSPGPFGARGRQTRGLVYHENKCIIPWERVFDKGEF